MPRKDCSRNIPETDSLLRLRVGSPVVRGFTGEAPSLLSKNLRVQCQLPFVNFFRPILARVWLRFAADSQRPS